MRPSARQVVAILTGGAVGLLMVFVIERLIIRSHPLPPGTVVDPKALKVAMAQASETSTLLVWGQ